VPYSSRASLGLDGSKTRPNTNTFPTQTLCSHAKKGTAEAVPFPVYVVGSPLNGRDARAHIGHKPEAAFVWSYEPLTTSRLFSTLNTPNTWFAFIPAICLSMGLATVPYRLSLPLSTTMRIGLAGSLA